MERVKYRDILVCYDDFKIVGWRTQEELDKLLKEQQVDYFVRNGKLITPNSSEVVIAPKEQIQY